jgi:hypothetical protein
MERGGKQLGAGMVAALRNFAAGLPGNTGITTRVQRAGYTRVLFGLQQRGWIEGKHGPITAAGLEALRLEDTK